MLFMVDTVAKNSNRGGDALRGRYRRTPEIPTYIGIADKALHLKKLNMNPNQIAVALKVDRTTVLRDLRWVKSIPVHATGPPRN